MMRAARMYGFRQPLRIEEVDIPTIGPDEVLVKVDAAGMCRTDWQLVDSYFKDSLPVPFPMIPGHEIAGTVTQIGGSVPSLAGLSEGDLVAVAGGWGCGLCRQCRAGNTQICTGGGTMPGFGQYGGYAEYIPVNYRWLVKADRSSGITAEQLAPLTDAGATPYRGLRKLRDHGVMGPGMIVGVMGVSALGTYGVQYAKLLAGGATVVAFDRNDEKLAVAKSFGADVTVNIRDRSIADVKNELEQTIGRTTLDAIIDCAGAEATIQLGMGLLATSGAYTSVGLVGDRINIPLFPLVAQEFTYFGSFYANNTDVAEAVALAEKGLIKDTIEVTKLDDVNETLARIGAGDVIGRAVISFA